MNGNMKVLMNLIQDKNFAEEMDKDVDEALKNSGFNVDAEFANRLKIYGKANGFFRISESDLSDVNESLVSAFGLESRW